MNADHPKYLHSVKIKEAATTATSTTTAAIGVTGCKMGRRRRLISREASNLSNSSVEAGGGEYHAQEPAAVPFMWESSPGTPKRHILMRSSNCDHHIDPLFPPLTPPPSYQYKGNKYATNKIRPAFSCSKKKKENDANNSNNNVNNNNNVNRIQSIFPRLSFKRENSPTLSSSSSTKSSSRPSTSTSSSSSSSSSPSSQPRSVVLTPSPIHRQRLSFEYSSAAEVEEEEEEGVVGRSGSPVSTLCFRRLSCCNAKFRGLYSTWF